MPDSPKDPESAYVKLAGTVGGSAVAVFVIAVIFGGQGWPAAVAVVALAGMGFGIATLINKNR